MARLKDFKRILKMDDVTIALLNRSLEEEVLNKVPTIKKELAKNPFRSSLTEYTEVTRKHLPLFGEWFNIAIMDLITCSNFIDDPNWIGRRLGIKPRQVKEALRLLEDEGFISKVDGQWAKTTKRIRIPTHRSMDIIRGIHAQLIQLAMQKLMTETAQVNFDARLINGVMFAANPANLQRAKDRLNDAIYEAAEILAEGECTEVYQINLQLFPLTKT
ncbi:hypothetical protein D3C72_1205470 [compost metagenome]